MHPEDEFIERILRKAGEAVGPGPAEEDFQAHREPIVTTVRTAVRRRNRTRRRVILAVAVALVALGIVAAIALSSDDELAFYVGSPQNRGLEGQRVSAATTGPVPLVFAHSGRLELQAGAAGVVHRSRDDGVDFALEAGRLEVVARARDGATWQVRAGPYRLAVASAELEVDWRPQPEALRVDVRRGAVVVTDTRDERRRYRLEEGKSLRVGDTR